MTPTERATSIKLNNSGPLDSLEGPYDSIASACASIPNVVDSEGKNFRIGKKAIVKVSGKLVAYWWPNGVYGDADIVPVVDLSGYVSKSSDIVNDLTSGGATKALSAEQGIIIESTFQKKEIFDSNSDQTYQMALVDEDGFIGPLFIDSSGAAHFREIDDLSEKPIAAVEDNEYKGLAIVDEDGFIGLSVPSSAAAGNRLIKTIRRDGNFPYELNHLLHYGQSVAMGWGALGLITTTSPFDAVMFAGGLRPENDNASADSYNSLIPLSEQSGNNCGESPASGMVIALKELIETENGLTSNQMQFTPLVSIAAKDGQPIANLMKGGQYYNRIVNHITKGKANADILGLIYGVSAIEFTQGEYDYQNGITPIETYKARLKQLRSDANADIKAITGQTENVKFLVTQVCAVNNIGQPVDIAEAQRQCALEDENIIITTPTYFFDFNGGGPHILPHESKWLGAYMGLAYKRTVVDQIRWRPVEPLSATKSGEYINIKFNVPYGPLVFDTTRVSDPGHFGFDVVDSYGVNINITSVTLTRWNQVTITLQTAAPDGARVRYGYNTGTTTVAGRLTGPRGCLRDSQGDEFIFDRPGLSLPMHNWCIFFNILIL